MRNDTEWLEGRLHLRAGTSRSVGDEGARTFTDSLLRSDSLGWALQDRLGDLAMSRNDGCMTCEVGRELLGIPGAHS